MLLTAELRTQLRRNADTSERGEIDHRPVVKFFLLGTSAIWLFTELAADHDTLFGVCDLAMALQNWVTPPSRRSKAFAALLAFWSNAIGVSGAPGLCPNTPPKPAVRAGSSHGDDPRLPQAKEHTENTELHLGRIMTLCPGLSQNADSRFSCPSSTTCSARAD